MQIVPGTDLSALGVAPEHCYPWAKDGHLRPIYNGYMVRRVLTADERAELLADGLLLTTMLCLPDNAESLKAVAYEGHLHTVALVLAPDATER